MSSQPSRMNEPKTPTKIIGVQFSILSPEEIRKNSVVEITSRDTYINNKPVIGGLFDPRMGVLEPGLICPTDGLTYINTPGYFGHIELARPVFFIQHIKEIMKICKSVCFKCSKLLISKTQHKHVLNMKSEQRWEYVTSLASKVKRCGDMTEGGCGCKQPDKIKLENIATLYGLWDKIETDDPASRKMKVKLSPELVLKIFRRITDEDVSFMGLSPVWSRPDWMICQVLPVPPPAVRPSVKHDAQQRSEDDLTHIYCNIIKTNTDLINKKRENAQANAIEGLTSLLQYFVAMIVNNKVKGSDPMAQRNGRPFQCIMGRLNSKNGRIRGNLMGKRVDFSARSVITGDPNLSIRELGVPMKIAMNLTIPVLVNDRNYKFLMKLLQNGPDVHPGAKILEKKNGESISLRYVDRSSIRLDNGDKVHRHMMDGDIVLFNRQPSLHKMSMMAHKVRIMKVGDTFRMNVGDTKPYNADFDGDEMNMHLPQNILAATELTHLAAIPYQIISPASNSPIIGIYQDSMLGSYRFTRPNIKMSPRDAMNLLMMYRHVNVEKLFEKGNEVSSFDVFSQIFPPLTMKYETKLMDKNENKETSNNILEIRNGQYIRGQLEKSVLGGSTKGIIHRVCNDFSNMAASNFIDDLQNIITEYMKSSSFSVGISDLISDRKTTAEIIQNITDKKMEVQTVIDEIHLGIFKNTTANSNNVEFEMKVNNILNKANEQAGDTGRKSLSKNNRFLMIVNSGAKGNLLNISQMISCLGQQNVDGKRIPYGFDSRTLPHYSKYDDSPGARGFIENSYISGLTPPEMFFHAMGGRIGLIDTAVKTSQTGYIQRRLIKGLEDLKVEYDMTVRNSKGKIIQFAYGDDHFDATKVENQNIPIVEMSIENIYTHYDILGLNDADSNLIAVYSKDTVTRLKKQKVECRAKCKKYIEFMIKARDDIVKNVFRYKNEDGVKLPVSLKNIIVNIQGQLNLNSSSIVDITPLEAFELVEETFVKLEHLHFAKPTELFKVMYMYYLSPRDLLVNKRFHRKALILLLETIHLKYRQAIIHPGEMVGVIAGQSIGEPTTQLTLNTFHSSGIASKSNVTRGVPRIEEILRLTKNPKNPSMTVHLKSVDEQEQDKAIKFATMMEHTKLVDLVKSVQLCFDPSDKNTLIVEDKLLMAQFYEFEDLMEDCLPSLEKPSNTSNKTKWIIRMEIDPEVMLNKNITMDDIHFAIKNSNYGNEISCVYSDYNMDKLVFRIRLSNALLNKNAKKKAESLDQSDDIYLLKHFQDSLLNGIVLRGVNRIENVQARKVQNMVVREDAKFTRKDTWILDTTGSNLLDTLALDFIDSNRTYSNDIKEIFHVLGIEAARQILFNEFTEVMEFADVYINYHHLSLLCDRMCSTKDMVSIFRSGILNDDIGPISKSTFEVQTEVLLSAARHAEFDHMRGVSASVMMGQYGYFGTNAFNLVLDVKEMEKLDSEMADVMDRNTEIENMFNLSKDAAVVGECSKADIEIRNNVENILREDTGGLCDDDYNMGF
jgi:DNA-directed RNA polymerase II subunit RPB1